MRTTIVLTDELTEKAKALGINISEVCRNALEQKIKAVQALATIPGDDWETVTVLTSNECYREPGKGIGASDEWLQFTGKLLLENEDGDRFYLTPKGNIIQRGDDGYRLACAPYDDGYFDGFVRQTAETVMGEIPTPTVWDI